MRRELAIPIIFFHRCRSQVDENLKPKLTRTLYPRQFNLMNISWSRQNVVVVVNQ